MPKVGIICDLGYGYSPCFMNYECSLGHIFGDIIYVSDEHNLDGLDMCFIGNDHFRPHYDIWSKNSFIKTCNEQKIKFIVFTAETIDNPYFPENLQIQKKLEQFNHLYQYVIDIEDMKKFNKKQMRGIMSKHFKYAFNKSSLVLNKCLFIGKYIEPEYEKRRQTIEAVKTVIDVDIVPQINSWCDYINLISSYRFVLSPLSNGNFFPLRFYEILLAHSIPLQEVKPNTLQYYKEEANFYDCIYFENTNELKEKISKCTINNSTSEIFMEDHIVELLKGDNLYG